MTTLNKPPLIHHARTWNREFGSRSKFPKRKPTPWPDFSNPLADKRIDPIRRLYFLLAAIKLLLRRINPGSTWHQRLFYLLQKHIGVSNAHVGMPENWTKYPYRDLT